MQTTAELTGGHDIVYIVHTIYSRNHVCSNELQLGHDKKRANNFRFVYNLVFNDTAEYLTGVIK
jgi:predicted nucleic acid-binding Zn ribbon protein